MAHYNLHAVIGLRYRSRDANVLLTIVSKRKGRVEKAIEIVHYPFELLKREKKSPKNEDTTRSI